MGEIFTFARLRPIAKLGSFDIGETIAHRLNKTALDFVVYAPLGLFLQYQAWRKNSARVRCWPIAAQGVWREMSAAGES
jgi:hypothetical protein